jgi:hypothetical protein
MKRMPTEKQLIHNHLTKIKGINSFIDYLLSEINTTVKQQGTLFTTEHVIKLCKDKKKQNDRTWKQMVRRINRLKNEEPSPNHIYTNHGEDDFNTWGKI